MAYQVQTKHTFNGTEYEITQGADLRWEVRKAGEFRGSYAALHGAVDAAVSDAYPREPRRSLRQRP